MPWIARHKQRRGRLGIWEANLALGGDGTAPINAPLTIKPTSAPSGTSQAGDIYFDSTTNELRIHNGTAYPGSSMPRQTIKTVATVLTAADNGSLCLFTTAAGQIYTLPASSVGLWFEFHVDVSATSLVHRIVCPTGSFLIGSILQSSDGTYVQVVRTANGTTHLAWEGEGSTKGGLIGDHMWITCRSATTWEIRGTNSATGTEATPFVTS